MLAYAGVYWRMLTYAGVLEDLADVIAGMLTYAGLCWRMLAYADVC